MRQWGTGAPWHWDDQWGSGLNWSHPEMSFYIFQTGNASFYFKLCLLMTSGFSRTVQYIRIRAFPYFWHQLYLMEETRLWQVDKCIERFSSCLDWEKLTMAVAWSVMGCLSLIRNRFWVWEETTGIWVSHGGSKRKNERPKKEMSHCVDNFTVVMSPHRNLLESIKSRILEQTGDKNPVTKNWIWDALFFPDFIHSCQVLLWACVWIMFWCGPQEVVYCVSPLLDVSVYWITQGAARPGGTRCSTADPWPRLLRARRRNTNNQEDVATLGQPDHTWSVMRLSSPGHLSDNTMGLSEPTEPSHN